jgi:transcriptional regulator with PAS, ATPase and Fis domain
MAERPPSPNERRPSGESRAVRWQAILHHSRDALFLLNHHRRLLAVNPRWEEVTDLPLVEVRGLLCRRRAGEAGPLEALAAALAPPAEVFEGRGAHARRRIAGFKRDVLWWDLDFLPIQDGKGRTRVLGKITPVSVEEAPRLAPLPERLATMRERLEPRFALDTIASESLTMRRVLDQVRLAGQSRVPVLIVGEAGTGKQRVARVIHHQGATPERSFATLDSALPPEALETALFGESGLLSHPGLGTLFLRDLPALPRDLQARLCDRLDTSPIAGPRLIGSCRADPLTEVRSQRLLDRLHATLATLVIELPPLRDRRPDLPALAERMLATLAATGDKHVTGLTTGAWDVLRDYPWPGNLRELHALLAGAFRRCDAERIDVPHLPRTLRLRHAVEETPGADPVRKLPLAEILEGVERKLMTFALQKSGGNKSRAAEMLGLWRMHLLRRMEKLGIRE